MSKLSDQIKTRREALASQMVSLAEAANKENRALNADEVAKFDGMTAELEGLDKRLKEALDGEQRAADIDAHYNPQQRQEPQTEGLAAWARSATVGDGYDVQAVAGAERRALNAFRTGGETRAMALSGAGGVANDGVYGTLWEYAVAGSQILQAGVDIIQTTDGNTLPLPVVTAHATGASAAANANITASDASLGLVNLSATKYGYITYVPSELVADATFDLEGYLARAAGRELGKIISKVASDAAIAGFTASGATAPSGSIGALTGAVFSDAIFTLFHSVQAEYRSTAAFLMSDPTAAAVRKTKDGSGQYFWDRSLVPGNPGVIDGKPVYIDPNLPAPVNGNKIVYFGDWSALKVRIAGGLRFERSADFAFGSDQIAFRALVRTGAAVVDANAVKFLQLTAS